MQGKGKKQRTGEAGMEEKAGEKTEVVVTLTAEDEEQKKESEEKRRAREEAKKNRAEQRRREEELEKKDEGGAEKDKGESKPSPMEGNPNKNINDLLREMNRAAGDGEDHQRQWEESE